MAEHSPADFDPRQVALFLDKIARDRDIELHEIAQRRDAEIARIRGDAQRESRRLFRQSAEQLRSRLALERSRYLARIRSDLRRQRWEVLAEAQQRVLDAVSDRFRKTWEDPQRQWEWCRYWLQLAHERSGDKALRVSLGDGAAASARERIEQAIRKYSAGAASIVDTQAEPGICIEWGDYVMDGRLASQSAAITDAVLGRLSSLLLESDGEARR